MSKERIAELEKNLHFHIEKVKELTLANVDINNKYKEVLNYSIELSKKLTRQNNPD